MSLSLIILWSSRTSRAQLGNISNWNVAMMRMGAEALTVRRTAPSRSTAATVSQNRCLPMPSFSPSYVTPLGTDPPRLKLTRLQPQPFTAQSLSLQPAMTNSQATTQLCRHQGA